MRQSPPRKKSRSVVVSSIYGKSSLNISLRDTITVSDIHPIRIHDIQQCILWLLASTDFKPPKKFCLGNVPLLSTCVVVFVKNLPISISSKFSALTACSSLFPGHWLSAPLPFELNASQYKIHQPLKRLFELRQPKVSNKTTDSTPGSLTLQDLLLDRNDLLLNNFPLSTHKGVTRSPYTRAPCIPYIEIESMNPLPTHLPLVALDCEMIKCGPVYEIARISLVNEKGETVLDELIKPSGDVTDYVTAFSGITAELLADVTTTLTEGRDKLLQFVGPDTIIVGHSLENDLHCLSIIHSKIIDTSILYPHSNPDSTKGFIRKNSLKYLVSVHLKRRIQEKEGGHDSVEDSIACLDLMKLKLERGDGFGDVSFSIDRVDDLISKNGKSSCVFGSTDSLSQLSSGTCSVVPCSNDADVIEKVSTTLSNDECSDLIVLELDGGSNLNEQLFLMFTSVPSNSAFFLFSGGDKGAFDYVQSNRKDDDNAVVFDEKLEIAKKEVSFVVQRLNVNI
ncbi:hypothetical protein GEMRC1_001519 [Eukaryota sp. GEM-RC1]